MKKYLWEQYNGYTEMTEGKDITVVEIQMIYKELMDDYKFIADQIVDSIDRNDYIALSKLIGQRKQIQTALDEVDALYGDKLHKRHKVPKQIADGLVKSAYFVDARGEEALRSVCIGLESLNETVRTFVDKAVDGTSVAFNRGNQMHYKVSRDLLSKTTNGLLKMANTLKK